MASQTSFRGLLNHLGISPPALSYLLKEMVDEDLLSREPDRENGIASVATIDPRQRHGICSL
ncbi:MarR family transcriptional regulator [Nocardia sp. NPDC001965]